MRHGRRREAAIVFLGGFFGVIALALATMVATNILVDPFGRYDLVTIPGVNALRTQAGSHTRLSKPAMVCRDRPEAVVIGTSRIGIGFDPAHPAWGASSGRVFNLGMPGMGLTEASLMLRHAYFASGRLRTALVGLDFLMFNANREALSPITEKIIYDPGRLVSSEHGSCLASFFNDLDSWLGPKGLAQSAATIARQMPEAERSDPAKADIWMSLYRRDGLMDNAKIFESRAQSGGYRALFGNAQERYYASVVWLPPPDRNYCFTRDGISTFDVFRGMVRFARKSGIDLRLFVDPMHARMLLALQDAGLWSLFQEWKRELVSILAEEAHDSGTAAFPLWDFARFNDVTTESVPRAGNLTTPVKWFWEPAHYKRETGDLILDRILGHKRSAGEAPADFGILLTPDTIDRALAADTEKGRGYARREAEDAALVRGIINEVKAHSPLPCRDRGRQSGPRAG